MKKEVKILLAGSYCWYFGAALLGPMYALFAQSVGGDLLNVAVPYAAYLFVTGTLTVAVGRISDRISKMKLMVAGYILNALGTFAYLFVSGPLDLVIVQVLLGIAAAFATPTWDTLFTAYIDQSKAGAQWGWSDGGPQIVASLGVLGGGLLIKAFGFKGLFIVMGFMQCVATIVQISMEACERDSPK
jgi:MFS family permease